jgi:aurora kinase
LFVQEREQSTAHTHSAKLWKITDFHIVKQMGKGKFGNVYAAMEKSSDYLVALKKMSKQDLKDNDF